MNSFSGGVTNRLQALNMRDNINKGSDELTGNDSVVGSPVPSRPGSPGAREEGVPQDQGVTLDAFKKALAGNAQKKRTEIDQDE
jgi:glycerol 3-phosphatase-1